MTAIEYPREYMADGRALPLENGDVYIGEAHQDPQVHPIQVFWDAAMTVPAAQPLEVSGGYVMNGGSRADFYIAETEYSMRLRDRHGVQVDYIASVPNGLTGGEGAGFVGFSQNGIYPSGSMGAKAQQTICPMDEPFGAAGDDTADDGPALNAMFDHVRALLAANPFAAIYVTGGNGRYRTTQSIDATGIIAWNLNVSNLHIIGACTGKAVLDLIGTRGYVLNNVSIWGDKTNRPSTGFQAQRGTPTGFCDNAQFIDCQTDGWFSTAAVHDYGQETTKWDHCTIYNRDHTARVAIHEGYSAHPMTSDYASVMTGPTSFINKSFINCDYRYLPADENIAAITGFTTGANAVVTCPGHDFEIGDEVVFQYVGGMPATSRVIATVTNATSTTITTDLDTTGYGAYTSGGNVIRRAEHSPVYIARTEGFAMHDCYVVSYGRPPIDIGFPDAGFMRVEQLHFPNVLFEGAGQTSAVYFNTTSVVTVQGFTLTTYNANVSDGLLETTPSASVSIYNPKLSSVDHASNFPLTSGNSNFAAYGADVLFTSLALVGADTWSAFNGQITSLTTGQNTFIISAGLSLNNQQTFINGAFDAVPPVGTTTRYLDVSLGGVAYAIELKSRA